jgi:putative DNA primase/helicase
MFWGRGQNGKSTLLNVIRGILGPYCVTLPVAALLEQQSRRGSDATPELARLSGARLALASEPEKKERLSASSVKSLTGGEPIAARALYREFVEFVPVAKLVLTVNEKPIVSAQDHGMWRRLLLVEFGVQIPDSKLIGRFEHILLEEAPGILNWLLDGFRLWREQGLAVPEVVRVATEEYRADQDYVSQFLVTAIRRSDSPDNHVTSAELWHAYTKWCRENAVEPMSRNSFGRALSGHGLKRAKSSNIVYRGIELTPAYRDQKELDVGGSEVDAH